MCPSACPIFETTNRISMKIGIWGSWAYADGRPTRVILILAGKLYFVESVGRAVQGVGLQPLDWWDRGFESG
jgi:hypothetical protein